MQHKYIIAAFALIPIIAVSPQLKEISINFGYKGIEAKVTAIFSEAKK